MTNPAAAADYRVRRPDDKSASAPAPAAGPLPGAAEFLQLLARAARQFHTYPAASPMCTDAIDACHKAFRAMQLDQSLTIRVAAHELLIDEAPIGRGTVVEQELSRPLHRARVASIDVDCGVSARDWSQFCIVLAAIARASRSSASLAELLLDAGVGTITPRVTPRPEVFEVGAPPDAVQTLVDRERTRQATLGNKGGAPQHLYPPDKGWVRVDPTVAYESISLVDLAVLVNDPGELAAMLARLVDDDNTEDASPAAALEQRYNDVVMLIGALDPRLGRLLFSKLARAVLDLDAERRRALLKRAILPGLLDGRLDGAAVLGEFPDVDLADALCLLLDLEAAAPEMLPVALDRLKLPDERRSAVAPLIESRLERRAADAGTDRWAAAGLDRHAGMLTRVQSNVAKNFSEFTAFDLSITDQTTAALASVKDAIAASDALDVQLTCAVGLARIEPNPAVVSAVLSRAEPALHTLMRHRRWSELARWLESVSHIAASVAESRPDVAQAIRDVLLHFCDRDVVLQIAELTAGEPGKTHAAAIVTAVGPAIVPAWVDALASPGDRGRVRPIAALLTSCARDVAPAIVERLAGMKSEAACAAVGVLGYAGAGYEPCIAEQVIADDERKSREALRALARIGSARAAALIVTQLEHGPAVVRPAAEEALWRLPAPLAIAKTRDLLSRREFITHNPQAATRLLERAAQSTDDDGFDPVLESLTPLRFHFWSPAVARVGAKARELLQ